jgi:hypothetical protein
VTSSPRRTRARRPAPSRRGRSTRTRGRARGRYQPTRRGRANTHRTNTRRRNPYRRRPGSRLNAGKSLKTATNGVTEDRSEGAMQIAATLKQNAAARESDLSSLSTRVAPQAVWRDKLPRRTRRSTSSGGRGHHIQQVRHEVR